MTWYNFYYPPHPPIPKKENIIFSSHISLIASQYTKASSGCGGVKNRRRRKIGDLFTKNNIGTFPNTIKFRKVECYAVNRQEKERERDRKNMKNYVHFKETLIGEYTEN